MQRRAWWWKSAVVAVHMSTKRGRESDASGGRYTLLSPVSSDSLQPSRPHFLKDSDFEIASLSIEKMSLCVDAISDLNPNS